MYTHTQVSTFPLPLVFVNIRPQKDYLNMNLRVSVLWMSQTRSFVYYSYWSARDASADISVCRLTNEDITTFTFMHLADAFIQSDLQCIQAIHFI